MKVLAELSAVMAPGPGQALAPQFAQVEPGGGACLRRQRTKPPAASAAAASTSPAPLIRPAPRWRYARTGARRPMSKRLSSRASQRFWYSAMVCGHWVTMRPDSVR